MNQPINRRELLASSLVAASVMAAPAAFAAAAADQPAKVARTVYELRAYKLRRGPMQKRAEEYFGGALIPALRRLDTGPVGLFNVTVGPDNPSFYVLIPHPSIAAAGALTDALAADAEYQKAAEAFLGVPATDPSYISYESSLLEAFAGMPTLTLPPAVDQPRIFELRTYRSHSERAAVKKIEMFETLGEIAIFMRAGIRPVFFSRGLTGRDLPSLTYMVTFPDLAAREKAWNTFRSDPEWKALSSKAGYTDAEVVSSISSVMIAPAPGSQI
jgi:hypothetical protein